MPARPLFISIYCTVRYVVPGVVSALKTGQNKEGIRLAHMGMEIGL